MAENEGFCLKSELEVFVWRPSANITGQPETRAVLEPGLGRESVGGEGSYRTPTWEEQVGEGK